MTKRQRDLNRILRKITWTIIPAQPGRAFTNFGGQLIYHWTDDKPAYVVFDLKRKK